MQKKYVPELHLPRLDVDGQIANFLNTDIKTLIVTGPSGIGKSCEICAISEYFLSIDQPVLFFNGSLLEGGILDAVANEFEWQYEAEISPIRILKRIERFSREKGCVILVDAIDEWSHSQRAVRLANLIKLIEGRKIKLILSCKDSSIDSFTLKFQLSSMRAAIAGPSPTASDREKRVPEPVFGFCITFLLWTLPPTDARRSTSALTCSDGANSVKPIAIVKQYFN